MLFNNEKKISCWKFSHVIVRFFFILLLLVTKSAFAYEVKLTDDENNFLKDHPEIILGSDSDWQPYIMKNSDGSITGFDNDILNLINEYTGANFILATGKWKEIVEQAKNNEIDGLSTSSLSEKRKGFLNVSDSYFSFSKTLLVANNNPKNIQSVNDLTGKRVGYQAGNDFNKMVLSRYKNITMVPVETLKGVVEALITGKIDAAIESNSIYHLATEGAAYLKTVDIFPDSKLKLVFSIRKDYPQALSIINKGLNAIPAEQKLRLVNKWFIGFEKALNKDLKIDLTEEEKVWLANNPVITVGFTDKAQPLFVRENNGDIAGIIPDIFELLAERSGLTFKYVADELERIVAQVQTGKIDVIGASSKLMGLSLIKHKFDFYTVIYARKDRNFSISTDSDIDGLRVAYYQKAHYINKFLQANSDKLTLLPFDSVESALNAVFVSDADIYIGLNSDSYTLTKHTLLDIEPIHVFTLKALAPENYIAVRPNAALLTSILKKAVSNLSLNDINPVMSKWIGSSEQKQKLNLSLAEKHYLAGKANITVGSMDKFVPFNFLENGQPSGYSVEYMKLIAEQIGKDIKFVSKPLRELLSMLKHKELDMIPHLAVTPEREKFVDYTNFSHISFLTGFVLHKNESLNSLDDLKGKTLAVIDKYFIYDHLKENHPEITLLVTKSAEESINAVAQHKADAAIDNIPTLNFYIEKNWLSNLKITTIDDLHIAMQTELPMAVYEGNFLLKSILEKANDSVPPALSLKLKQKWLFGENFDKERLILNERELKFVKDHPLIRFRISPDRPPFEFIDKGKAAGLAVDYIKAAAKYAGFTPEFVINNMPNSNVYQEIEGERTLFDTLAFSVKGAEREKRFAYGDEFLAYPMMIIGHSDSPFIVKTADLNDKKVVVEKGFLTNKWLQRDYPRIKIVSAASTRDALQMVNDKKVDAYIGNLAVANYMMINGGMQGLKIMAPSGYENIKYSFIAPKEWPELASILSKGYRSLSPDFHSILQQRWFALQIVERMDYVLLWKILGFIGFIGFWALWWHRRVLMAKRETENVLSKLQIAQLLLEEQNIKLERVSVTDKLTSLYNRQKLDQVLETEYERTQRYGDLFGVIIADIDHFKQVNDTYGHQVGDEVLKAFAHILKTRVRKLDTAGRWGGEEFMIICSKVDLIVIQKVAEDLRAMIDSHDFPKLDHLTASFGVALCNKEDSIETVISRADSALYLSKQRGRNRVTLM